MSDKTIFVVLHITSRDGGCTAEDILNWCDSLSQLTNGKMSVDGIIARREAPRVHELDTVDGKAALNEYKKAIELLHSDLSEFEGIIIPDE